MDLGTRIWHPCRFCRGGWHHQLGKRREPGDIECTPLFLIITSLQHRGKGIKGCVALKSLRDHVAYKVGFWFDMCIHCIRTITDKINNFYLNAASAPELCPTIIVFALQLSCFSMNGIHISSRANTVQISSKQIFSNKDIHSFIISFNHSIHFFLIHR